MRRGQVHFGATIRRTDVLVTFSGASSPADHQGVSSQSDGVGRRHGHVPLCHSQRSSVAHSVGETLRRQRLVHRRQRVLVPHRRTNGQSLGTITFVLTVLYGWTVVAIRFPSVSLLLVSETTMGMNYRAYGTVLPPEPWQYNVLLTPLVLNVPWKHTFRSNMSLLITNLLSCWTIFTFQLEW